MPYYMGSWHGIWMQSSEVGLGSVRNERDRVLPVGVRDEGDGLLPVSVRDEGDGVFIANEC